MQLICGFQIFIYLDTHNGDIFVQYEITYDCIDIIYTTSAAWIFKFVQNIWMNLTGVNSEY